MEFGHYIVILFVSLSVVYGIRSYNFSNGFFKLFLFQAIVYLCLCLCLLAIQWYNETAESRVGNHMFINIHVGLEAILLFKAALRILDSKLEKKLVSTLFVVFFLVWIFQLSYHGISFSSSIADLTACISLTAVYSFVLNKSIRMNRGPWWKSPEVLSSIGLLVYFAGSVPFVAMISYLAQNEPKMYYVMYHILNVGLANVRYILLFASFVLIYKTRGNTQLQIA